MRLERLRAVEDCRYEQARRLYRSSFPVHEQREDASQRRILKEDAYRFFLIYDGDDWVGLMLGWESAAFIYVEHFCILPELRGRQYGQRALEKLRESGKPVILEIDPPVDEIAVRRKKFYERAGYLENGFPHVHPPYHTGLTGHPLMVMSCPEPLSQAEYQAFDQYLKDTVMGN